MKECRARACKGTADTAATGPPSKPSCRGGGLVLSVEVGRGATFLQCFIAYLVPTVLPFQRWENRGPGRLIRVQGPFWFYQPPPLP